MSKILSSSSISLVSTDATPNRSDDIVANEKITARAVILIDSDGRNCGEVPLYEARKRAAVVGLDLIQVSKGIVPTVKMLELGRYRYDRAQAERESRRNQRATAVEVKEVQLTPTTQFNDMKTIAKRATKFLSSNNEVKIVVRFEGRQLGHTELGHDKIQELIGLINDGGTLTRFKAAPSMNGDRSMSCVVIRGDAVRSDFVEAANT